MQEQTQYRPLVEPAMQPQEVVIIQDVPASRSKVIPNFASKTTMVLSGIQLAMGILCLALNSIAIGIYGDPMYSTNRVGAGIWCGLLFITASAVGLGAAIRKTYCLIISFMTMCIMSAAFTVPIFIVSSNEVSRSPMYSGYYYHFPENKRASIGINATMLILALVELVIAIIASTLCCKVVCGCCLTPAPGAIQYANQPNTVAYAQGGALGVTYYTPQSVAYTMQPNTLMMSHPHGLPVAATQPIAQGQGHQPTAPRPVAIPPSYSERTLEKD